MGYATGANRLRHGPYQWQRLFDVRTRHREGEVRQVFHAGVLHDGVDADPGLRQRLEEGRRDAGTVRHPQHSHLRDVGVARHTAYLAADLHACLPVNQGARGLAERRGHQNRNVIELAQLNGAGLHLGAAGRQLQHLLVVNLNQLARLGHDARVGGVDALDVRVDLASLRAKRGCQRDGRRIRTAAAQRGDLLLLGHSLESADHCDAARIQLRQDAVRRDVSNARLSVQRFGLDARLQAREAHRRAVHVVERHRHQRA